MADVQNISLDNPGNAGAVAVPVVFALIFLLGTVGNGLVLAVLLQPGPGAWQEPGSTTDLFILNLAVADLCFILCCVPFQATIYTLDAWLFGALVCKAVHLLIYLTMYASSFTLAAVSIDRYLALRHPLRSRALRTPRNARAAVGLVWLLAALFSAPYLSYYGTVRYGALELCVPAWEDARRRALDVATFAVGYLLPVTVSRHLRLSPGLALPRLRQLLPQPACLRARLAPLPRALPPPVALRPPPSPLPPRPLCLGCPPRPPSRPPGVLGPRRLPWRHPASEEASGGRRLGRAAGGGTCPPRRGWTSPVGTRIGINLARRLWESICLFALFWEGREDRMP
ncbi:galanin receptor type 3 isoform X2 [Choloepus didactylus]|uniref:galanin receptor type 3 isoform X2 n=1 Tax=Choloepus didactylus TaxID=27675 RepID=UPI00189D5636|nr:galanin receptor type 3 isoform X2 [Choloepus didactylus]